MPHFIQLPEEVAIIFGSAAPKFVDFLASTFSIQRDEVVQMSALSFEKTLQNEVSGLRAEMAGLHEEMAELRGETRTSIAEVRAEMAELRAEMKADFAAVHREIVVQTRWFLVGLLGAATLYPLLTQLMERLF